MTGPFGFTRVSVLDELARRAREEGRRAYGAIELDEGHLRTLLSAILARSSCPPSRLHAGDLFLVAALEARAPGAWEAFLAQEILPLRRMLRERGLDAEATEELLSALPGELLDKPSGQVGITRLASYDGEGSLRSFLSIVLFRRVARERRSTILRERIARELGETADPVPDCAAQTAESELGARCAESLRKAWAELNPRERLAVAWRYVDGLRGEEIAKLLQVGEPRVSRIIDKALRKLREALQDAAIDRDSTSSPAVRRAMAAQLAILARGETPRAHGDASLGTP